MFCCHLTSSSPSVIYKMWLKQNFIAGQHRWGWKVNSKSFYTWCLYFSSHSFSACLLDLLFFQCKAQYVEYSNSFHCQTYMAQKQCGAHITLLWRTLRNDYPYYYLIIFSLCWNDWNDVSVRGQPMRPAKKTILRTEKCLVMHNKVEEEEMKGQRKKMISWCLNALTWK